ncbi:MAG: hypothetical protein J7F05_01110 [Trichodesmium erythraeum GBRTRLIN201]|nr:hypothetical protein [Trichodesmium erythraeum GBRTRLIN201]
MVNELEIEIPIAHDPTYPSKYNSIENPLFSDVSPLRQGVKF